MTSAFRLFLIVALAAVASPGRADWRTETGVFRVGVVDHRSGAFSPEHFAPFRDAVSAAIGMPVEVLLLRDAPSLIDAQTAGRIEYAVLTGLGYAAAQETCECLVPLAAPTSASGALGVRSVLVARTGEGDGGDTPEPGSIGYGPAGSLTGDLAPSVSFRLAGKPLLESGLDLALQPDFETARDAFLAGDLSGFFAWEYVGPDDASRPEGGLAAAVTQSAGPGIEITWRSRPLRFGPHAVRDTVPEDVRKALRSLLIGLEGDAPEAFDVISPSLAGAFEVVTPDDYAYATELVRSLSEER